MSEITISNKIKFLIFAFAFILRAAYVLAQYKLGVTVGAFVSGDSVLYIDIAKNILAGNGFAHDNALTAYVSPGFPLFLAGCFSIFGENTLWTSLLQCLLSAAACVFIALVANLMFGKRVGIIAGIIAAFYYELILWTSGQILTEPLYTFLLSAAIYALLKAYVAKKSAELKFAIAGILFGLSALTRPLALPVALGLGCLLILVAFFYDRKKIIQGLIFVAVCVLIMQPWGIRNYISLNYYLLTSSEGGYVFWMGNNTAYDLYENPDFKKFGGYTAMFNPPPELAGQVAGKPQKEANQIYTQEAMRHIYTRPGAFFSRALHKSWNMWRPTFSGSSFSNKLISYTIYPLLLLLSLAGIFLTWRDEMQKFCVRDLLLNLTKPFGLLCVFLVIHLLLHAVINAEIRFRVPLWASLIPFAALSITRIYDCLLISLIAKNKADII